MYLQIDYHSVISMSFWADVGVKPPIFPKANENHFIFPERRIMENYDLLNIHLQYNFHVLFSIRGELKQTELEDQKCITANIMYL